MLSNIPFFKKQFDFDQRNEFCISQVIVMTLFWDGGQIYNRVTYMKFPQNSIYQKLLKLVHFYLAPVGESSIAMRVSVCLHVSPLAYLNKCLAVAEMGNRLATIDISRRAGCCAPFGGGSWVTI